MAWPVNSRSLTFYNGTVVTPSFLNDVQDKIIGIYGGTLSHLGVVVDGTGNQASSPVTGGVTVSAVGYAATVPTPTLTDFNTLYRGGMPIAWARWDNAGSITFGAGYNVTSVVRSSTGLVVVTLITAGTATTKMAAFASYNIAGTGVCTTAITSTSTIAVRTYDSSFTLADGPAMLLVFGY